MTLLADLEEFAVQHRPHGPLSSVLDEPTRNGYLLQVACSCGVTFMRWITLEQAAGDLAVLASLN